MSDLLTTNAVFKFISVAVVAIGGWAMKMLHFNLAERIGEHGDELARTRNHFGKQLQIHVTENRGDHEKLREATNDSVTRLHDKIDTAVRDLTNNQNEQTNRIIDMLTK